MLYEIIDVPQKNPCDNCVSCMRLRLLEMGLIGGQKIEISEKKLGLRIVNILNQNNTISSRIALREEEFERLCIKEV